eukprot:SAG31_NODE_1231_length_9212_cov_2.857566_10_plen_84_part_00
MEPNRALSYTLWRGCEPRRLLVRVTISICGRRGVQPQPDGPKRSGVLLVQVTYAKAPECQLVHARARIQTVQWENANFATAVE